MTAKAKPVQVGQTVQYFGSSTQPLAALVLMTPAEFDPERAGLGMEAPADGEVTLEVHRVSGARYIRHNVPLFGTPAHEALIAKAEPGEEGQEDMSGSTGDDEYPVTVRYWKPIA